MKVYLVNSFFPKHNYAKKIARLAIKKKLAACVNMNKNVNSIFMWKNKLCEENEIEISFKTCLKKVKPLINFIESKHPYECPPIISIPIGKINKKFSDWILDELK